MTDVTITFTRMQAVTCMVAVNFYRRTMEGGESPDPAIRQKAAEIIRGILDVVEILDAGLRGGPTPGERL